MLTPDEKRQMAIQAQLMQLGQKPRNAGNMFGVNPNNKNDVAAPLEKTLNNEQYVTSYEPTATQDFRYWLGDKTQKLARGVGASGNYSEYLRRKVAGTPASAGIADFVPLVGDALGFQDAGRIMDQGELMRSSGDFWKGLGVEALGTGVGALSALGMLGVTKPFTKAGSTVLKNIASDVARVANKGVSQPVFDGLDDIGQRMAIDLRDNYDDAVKRYAKNPATKNGKVLNTDEARLLSPDYVADRTKSANVHEPSSKFIKDRYAQILDTPAAKGEEDLVMFTAGGTGAGKTSGVDNIDELSNLRDISKVVYDSNMSTYKSARKKIDQALDSGHRVAIIQTHRDPVDALVNGALPRAMRQYAEHGTGRTVPLDAHLDTHLGALKTVKRLEKEFADNPMVGVRYVDNSRGRYNAALVNSSDDLPVMDMSNLKKELSEALEIEFKEGRINREVYNGFKQTIKAKKTRPNT